MRWDIGVFKGSYQVLYLLTIESSQVHYIL